jgi:CAF1 family ribonuclease
MGGHYVAMPFNFFISPVVDPMFHFERTFLCEASALEMLVKEGLDLNHLFRNGIHYLSRIEEKEIRHRQMARETGKRDIVVPDEAGKQFLDDAKLPDYKQC